jgi:hypothetical protein
MSAHHELSKGRVVWHPVACGRTVGWLNRFTLVLALRNEGDIAFFVGKHSPRRTSVSHFTWGGFCFGEPAERRGKVIAILQSTRFHFEVQKKWLFIIVTPLQHCYNDTVVLFP